MYIIKTITCHRVFNHGASLQQFALLEYLTSLGHQVETINYQPHYLADNYRYLGVPNDKFRKNAILKMIYILAKLPKRFADRKRRDIFDLFEKQYIPQTKRQYKNNKELKANLPNADIYICGSDQIWNTLFENGKDPAFYLDFVPKEKLTISYAASFATEEIAENLKDFVKEKVNAIDCISVRESSGVRILNDLNVEDVTHVLDPVFLLSKEEWLKKFKVDTNYKKPYVLVYDFDNNPLIEQYAKFLKENKGYKIIALSHRITYADEVFWSIGPDQFLHLMAESTWVLANSFHATAFSVIFEKQFLIFNRTTGINTRMQDFLGEFELSERMVSVFDKSLINNAIDFSNIKLKLENKISDSKSFLNKALHYEKMD